MLGPSWVGKVGTGSRSRPATVWDQPFDHVPLQQAVLVCHLRPNHLPRGVWMTKEKDMLTRRCRWRLSRSKGFPGCRKRQEDMEGVIRTSKVGDETLYTIHEDDAIPEGWWRGTWTMRGGQRG